MALTGFADPCAMPRAKPLKAIGGVLPDAAGEPADPADSLWRRWTLGFAHSAGFRTARGAIRAVLVQRGVRRLWLPAYTCAATLEAAPPGCDVTFYGHGPGLALSGLSPAPGDAVLGVDYFGRCDPALAERARAEPGVLWIEDRAQAADPQAPPWGEIVVYSPRKLIGVGDGGLLVSRRPLPQPGEPALDDPALWAPHQARSLDPDGASPDAWMPLFQAREASFASMPIAMQPRTRALLHAVAASPLIERRIANARVLQQRLADFALWDGEAIGFAPLVFPVRVSQAGAAVRALGADGVFCPRHWADLASPASAFPQAHRLSAELVSLPCDQRYAAADMERVADAVRRLCSPADGSR